MFSNTDLDNVIIILKVNNKVNMGLNRKPKMYIFLIVRSTMRNVWLLVNDPWEYMMINDPTLSADYFDTFSD